MNCGMHGNSCPSASAPSAMKASAWAHCVRGPVQDADLEDDRDETDVEESDADGFVVPNGYVSEDEGVRSVQQELDQLCGDLDGDLDGGGPCIPLTQPPSTPL